MYRLNNYCYQQIWQVVVGKGLQDFILDLNELVFGSTYLYQGIKGK